MPFPQPSLRHCSHFSQTLQQARMGRASLSTGLAQARVLVSHFGETSSQASLPCLRRGAPWSLPVISKIPGNLGCLCDLPHCFWVRQNPLGLASLSFLHYLLTTTPSGSKSQFFFYCSFPKAFHRLHTGASSFPGSLLESGRNKQGDRGCVPGFFSPTAGSSEVSGMAWGGSGSGPSIRQAHVSLAEMADLTALMELPDQLKPPALPDPAFPP